MNTFSIKDFFFQSIKYLLKHTHLKKKERETEISDRKRKYLNILKGIT